MSHVLAMTDVPVSTALEPEHPTTAASSSGGWLAGLGSVVGLGAVIASSCCALPLILASLGATGAVFTGLEFMAAQRAVLLGSATAAIAVAWVLFLRRRATACSENGACSIRARSRRTALILGIGTALIGLALIWQPYIEPAATKLVMAARSGKIR